jgi:hypothetical protein
MTIMNVDPFYQDVARGVLLILAVGFDRLSARFSLQSVAAGYRRVSGAVARRGTQSSGGGV